MMTLEMIVEVLAIVKREKIERFESLDKKYEEFFKEEFINTEIDAQYQEEFKELQNKYNPIIKELEMMRSL